MMTTLTARPEAITFDPQQSALIVVDMQNAYATPGGYLDLAGFDVSTTRPVIANIQTAVTAARAAGMLIIWFQNGWDEQYVEAGGPGSPNFHKSNALKTMRKQPQLQGNCWRKAHGIINWWMNWCRSLAILCCRSRATAVSSIRRWTAFCAAVEYAIWFSPVSLPTSASNRRYAMAFSGVFRRGAGRRNTPGGAGICTESRVVQYRNLFWLGQRRRNILRRAFSHVLCSYRLRSLTMPKSVIIPAGSSAPLAPFVPGTLADGVVYVSGTLAFDQHNNVLFADDPKAQTRHVLETIRKVIETAGGTMADVTFNSIFITDWKNYAAINEIYAEFFPGDKPARFCIQCGLVKPDALVEIATIAHIAK